MQYNFQTMKTSFVGSVAFHFEEILLEAAADCGVTVGSIMKSPMQGLIKYHARQQ